ncbi:hypothetical protein [Herbidospora daliensis]|uniref:hypothetical protein n=1 Tax=Herbidospora daliensis TaxID=295585 RepID=UPI000782F999|nr:hypothetical protein [Herbidospora daliensis]
MRMGYTRLLALLADQIGAAQAAGQLDPGLDADREASLLHALATTPPTTSPRSSARIRGA